MNKKITSILRSPCCLFPLKDNKNTLACSKCKKRYQVIDNRPVLVTKERLAFNKRLLKVAADYTYDFEKHPFVKRLLPPSESLRIVNKERELIEKLGKESLVLNIGGERKGNNKKTVFVDIDSDLDVDVVADANDLPFKNNSFGLVICRYVLEHISAPIKVVDEIYRVLKDGGVVYIDMPFLQPFHPSPADYSRLTQEGLRLLMSKFKEVESGISQGPASALVWVLVKFPGTFFNNKFLYRISLFIISWLIFPLKYLDYLLVKKKFAGTLASGFYYIGKKQL